MQSTQCHDVNSDRGTVFSKLLDRRFSAKSLNEKHSEKPH